MDKVTSVSDGNFGNYNDNNDTDEVDYGDEVFSGALYTQPSSDVFSIFTKYSSDGVDSGIYTGYSSDDPVGLNALLYTDTRKQQRASESKNDLIR